MRQTSLGIISYVLMTLAENKEVMSVSLPNHGSHSCRFDLVEIVTHQTTSKLPRRFVCVNSTPLSVNQPFV